MEAMCADWLEQYDAWQEQVASDPRPIIEIDALKNGSGTVLIPKMLRPNDFYQCPFTENKLPMTFSCYFDYVNFSFTLARKIVNLCL